MHETNEPSALPGSESLDRASAAFALAASIAILFNTALALAKDLSPSLSKSMAALTGHHWTTHGLADLLLFLVLGLIFFQTRVAEKIPARLLVWVLVGASIVGAGGLVGWYLLF